MASERARKLAYRKRVLEEAAKIADECYHGPQDHGCTHGKEIAAAIRAKAGEE
jgi:hypothetical protein